MINPLYPAIMSGLGAGTQAVNQSGWGGYQSALQKQDAERKAYEQALLGSVTPPPTMETFAPQQMSFRPGALGIMALANILGNVIEPGAGNQGLNAFLGTVQGRIDQQNQANQLAVQQRNQLAQMQADFARRQKEAQAEAAKVRLGFAQQDVQRAEGKIDQFRQQAITQAKEAKDLKRFQTQQFGTVRTQLNNLSGDRFNPANIENIIGQLEQIAAGDPELQSQVEAIRQQAGPLKEQAKGKTLLRYMDAMQREQDRTGVLSEQAERVLRDQFRDMGLDDDELDYVPGVSLKTTAIKLDNQLKGVRLKIAEANAKFADQLAGLNLKSKQAAYQEQLKRNEKLDKEIKTMTMAAQGKGPDGKPLTVTAAFNALNQYDNKLLEAGKEYTEADSLQKLLQSQLDGIDKGNIPAYRDDNGNLITDKSKLKNLLRAEIQIAANRKEQADAWVKQLQNQGTAVDRIQSLADSAKTIAGGTQPTENNDPLGIRN